MFSLAVIGIANVFAQDPRAGAVLLVFPACYLLYFSMQGTMVVRNLLAAAPFLAIAAARGAGVVAEFFDGKRDGPAARLPRAAWWRVGWIGLLSAALGINAWWLIASAESIVQRHSDHFVREATEYVRAHSGTKFFLSPRMQLDLAAVASKPENVSDNPAEADAIVLYAREGMRRWHDWPANRRGLTQACFGPREMNFDMYPNWWGDDRIVVITRCRADEIGLLIAGSPQDIAEPAEAPAFRRAPGQAASSAPLSGDSLPTGWALPTVDPRILIPHAEAETIMGPIARGPLTGGWELDGTACTYLGRGGSVVSVAIISLSAFELERHDPQSVAVSNVGLLAYAARTGPMGDLRLFARSFDSAVIVHVSGGSMPTESRLALARRFAGIALDGLDEAQASDCQQRGLDAHADPPRP
jgi:hypothetical protein